MPLLFRKKIIQTNLSLFGLINGPSSPFVTLKDFRSISSDKLLSLKELYELDIHLISDQKILTYLELKLWKIHKMI